MSRYSQYTEEEIDAMCHEADRKSKEEINLQIQGYFNDGWTQEFYREQLKELKDSKDQKHVIITITTEIVETLTILDKILLDTYTL